MQSASVAYSDTQPDEIGEQPVHDTYLATFWSEPGQTGSTFVGVVRETLAWLEPDYRQNSI